MKYLHQDRYLTWLELHTSVGLECDSFSPVTTPFDLWIFIFMCSSICKLQIRCTYVCLSIWYLLLQVLILIHSLNCNRNSQKRKALHHLWRLGFMLQLLHILDHVMLCILFACVLINTSPQDAETKAAQDARKVDLFTHFCSKLRETESKMIQASVSPE